MDAVRLNVRDLGSDERRVYEQAIGRPLDDDAQVVIQIVSVENSSGLSNKAPAPQSAGGLPAWCNVYEGLSDEEIAEVERVSLQRSDLTRTFG